MEVSINFDPNMVRCSCDAIINFEPSKPDYAQKDETGQVISREAADHMANFRVRCSKCQKNFCTSCNRSPYHIGMTCEQAESNQHARKCRFCTIEIKKQYNHKFPAFHDCCGKPDCVKEIAKSCNKILACGHVCRGFADEQKCLPCLEDGCIEAYNKQVT